MYERSRQNIHTALDFLTMRVKNTDKDVWGTLKRVLKNLKGTKHIKLKLTVDFMSMINCECMRPTNLMLSVGSTPELLCH